MQITLCLVFFALVPEIEVSASDILHAFKFLALISAFSQPFFAYIVTVGWLSASDFYSICFRFTCPLLSWTIPPCWGSLKALVAAGFVH